MTWGCLLVIDYVFINFVHKISYLFVSHSFGGDFGEAQLTEWFSALSWVGLCVHSHLITCFLGPARCWLAPRGCLDMFLAWCRLAQVCLHVRGRDLRELRGPGPQQAWAQSWWALASFILLLRVSHRSARLKGRGDKPHLLMGGASESHAEVCGYRKGNNWPFLQTVHYDSVCFHNSAWLISLFVCLSLWEITYLWIFAGTNTTSSHRCWVGDIFLFLDSGTFRAQATM